MFLKNQLKFSAAALALGAANPVFSALADDGEKFNDPAFDRIVITASPIERSVGETIVNTSVVSGEELQNRLENTIGEILRRQPGVSSSFFGAGASRPVIRGLGGGRIRVLQDGIGSIDVSASSPDHAVAVSPATAERIEIVRGAGTLLYGSSAAGGVVNVFTGTIPREAPEDGFDGALRVGGSTVDNGFESAGGTDITLGEFSKGKLVLHADGFYREASDYEIPGFAESAAFRAAEEAEEHEDEDEHEDEEEHEEEAEAFGVLENSRLETYGGSAGLSWIFENGFFGVSGTLMDSNYGLPGGHGHHEHEDEEGEDEDHGDEDHEEEEEEGGVTLDLKQRRFDLVGEVDGDFALFQKVKVRFGYADYEHIEFEPNGEQGTVFSNEGFEGRFELVNKTYNAFGGDIDGAVGFHFRSRDFSAIGEEAFVPPTEMFQYGLFALEQYESGPWRLELGARYEHTDFEVVEPAFEETEGNFAAPGFERSFDSFSVSAGAVWKVNDILFVGLNGYRTERAPSSEELFSNGPHLATNAFEIGDQNLDEEVARGVEATARVRVNQMSLSISGYYTSYKDFIYETPTGEEEDELPVFQFVAEDAAFRGFEIQAEGELTRVGLFDIHGDASLDYVRATTDASGNDNLPRIPPLSGLVGIEARSDQIDARVELEFASEQDDVTEFELATDGYTVLNALVAFRPFNNEAITLRVVGDNLTNEEVRLHTSFIKDLAPLPGRNVKVSLTGRF